MEESLSTQHMHKMMLNTRQQQSYKWVFRHNEFLVNKSSV